MPREFSRFLLFLVIGLTIAAIGLSVFHAHKNPADHETCLLCRFGTSLTLFVLAFLSAVYFLGLPESPRRVIRTERIFAPEFLIRQRTPRAPPALLTA